MYCKNATKWSKKPSADVDPRHIRTNLRLSRCSDLGNIRSTRLNWCWDLIWKKHVITIWPMNYSTDILQNCLSSVWSACNMEITRFRRVNLSRSPPFLQNVRKLSHVTFVCLTSSCVLDNYDYRLVSAIGKGAFWQDIQNSQTITCMMHSLDCLYLQRWPMFERWEETTVL